jgi:5-formyltetrahydrofolate cyclo-ligase
MPTKDTSLLRQQLLSQRLSLEASNLSQKLAWDEQISANLAVFLKTLESQVQSIAFYWPIKGEPDIRTPLIEWSKAQSNRCLALPITNQNLPLKFDRWDETTIMRNGAFKIPEPENTAEVNVDMIIAPCLGWLSAASGNWRLGYGGGYYDRTLQSLNSLNRPPLFIGIGYEIGKLDPKDWEPQAHDIQLDLIITNATTYLSKQS